LGGVRGEKLMEDFEIKIRVVVYSPKGEFVKQCDNSSFSDKTIKAIMDEIDKEFKERG
jgi:hypothetical protein